MELPCHLLASLEGVIPIRVHRDFPQTIEHFHCFSGESGGHSAQSADTVIQECPYTWVHIFPRWWCCASSAAFSWKHTGQSHVPYSDMSALDSGEDFSASSPFMIINNAILSCKRKIRYGGIPSSKTTLLFPYLLRIALSPLNHCITYLMHFTVLVTDISLLTPALYFCNDWKNWRQF